MSRRRKARGEGRTGGDKKPLRRGRRESIKRLEKNAERARVHNGCAGKRRYIDIEVAKAAAIKLLISRELNATGVYLCHEGPHYHVTSDPRRSFVVRFDREAE